MDNQLAIERIPANNAIEIRVAGRLDFARSAQMEEAIRQEFEHRNLRIIMNLNGVEFISSAAIRVLVKYYKEAKSASGFLVVAQPSQAVTSALNMVGLSALYARPVLVNKKVESMD
ncbi:MAG: STAS domain-containing protein [Chitinophagales bacterium]